MFQQQYDPIYSSVYTNITGWNYGAYQNSVTQSVYLFMKQYTNFKISQTSMMYENGVQVNWICLTGGISITFASKQYSIPLNIVLPVGYPNTAPKIYLAYKLDAETAEQNPFIKNGSEVMNNYINKWQANSTSYTLGGLCYNLTKSFEMYPPLNGVQAKSTTTPAPAPAPAPSPAPPVQAPVTMAPAEVVEKAPVATVQPVQTAAPTPAEEVKTPEMEMKEELVAQATQKLISYKEIASTLPGGNHSDPVSTLIANAKIELGENGTKLQKQILMLENEIQEVKTHNEEMKEFISKNEGKEVTKVRTTFKI